MKKKILLFIKFIFFACGLFFLIFLACFYLTPYWRYSNDPDDAGETTRYENFYEMPENSLDYIVIGASNSYHGVDPMQVYAYSGFTGFDLGSPSQPMVCSYYWLKEALKSQRPKYVFVETGAFVRDIPSNERILKAILPMKPSLLKLEAIRDACSHDSDLLYTALFPLYQFHSRWKEFSKKDIVRKSTEPYLTRGATLRFVSNNSIEADRINLREEKNVIVSDDGSARAELEEIPLNESSEYWIGKIKELCNENDIECIPVKFPTKNWNERWSNEVRNYLETLGLSLLDMTEEDNYVDINWKKDSFDNGKHLNYYGMVKTSIYLADYLKSLGNLKSHKNESAYELWNSDLEKYGEWESSEIYELMDEKREKYDWFNRLALDREKYLILISVKNDAAAGWTKRLNGVFAKIGLETDFSKIKQESYIAVIDAGKKKLEIYDPDIMNYDFDWTDENGKSHAIHIKSGGIGGDCEIEVDGSEKSMSASGINIVVIDRENGECVASADYDTSSEDISFKSNGELEDTPILPDGDYSLSSENDESLEIELEKNPDDSYSIKNKHTGKYLSVLGRNKEGDSAGFEENEGLAVTKWRIYYADDGKYIIYSQFNGMVLNFGRDGFYITELNQSDEEQGLYIK